MSQDNNTTTANDSLAKREWDYECPNVESLEQGLSEMTHCLEGECRCKGDRGRVSSFQSKGPKFFMLEQAKSPFKHH
jgi:hypothetical protein